MGRRPPLTERQQEVLDFIVLRIVTEGLPPTVREICEHFAFQNNCAVGHLRALERKGYLVHKPNRARGLSLPRPPVDEATRLRGLALEALGALKAGDGASLRALLEQLAGHAKPHAPSA